MKINVSYLIAIPVTDQVSSLPDSLLREDTFVEDSLYRQRIKKKSQGTNFRS
jgi:hypothetical protein